MGPVGEYVYVVHHRWPKYVAGTAALARDLLQKEIAEEYGATPQVRGTVCYAREVDSEGEIVAQAYIGDDPVFDAVVVKFSVC